MAVGVPALRRAMRQKLLRSLLDGGPALASLLQLIAKRGAAGAKFSADLTQLLAHFAAAGIPLSAGRAAPPDVRLTERERQTLRLIAEGYSNKGMARELGISAETVKWHLKQLYEKLQVSGRIQALNQAREWQLLS